MNLYTLYNIEFNNKKLNSWYKRIYVRLINILLPVYYYVSGIFIKRSLGNKNLNNCDNYIVSLTSFPARINKVWLAIESILRQETKPDGIILWLYKGEFDEKKSLPKNLRRLEKWIQIKFCDDDLMSHNKYFHTMVEYPKANIITVDDDIIYPPSLIGDLKYYHQKYPDAICSTITRVINVTNGSIQPYKSFREEGGDIKKSHKYLQLGFGGVLYPPNSLHSEVFNKRILKQKALKADDLWLKVMSYKKETEIVSISNFQQKEFLPIIIKNNRKLMDSNIGEARNDKNMRNIMDYYKLPDSVFLEY